MTKEIATVAENVTTDALADALECFWNAALDATHRNEDATANAVMAGMVEGFAAMAHRLREHKEPAALQPSSEGAVAVMAAVMPVLYSDDDLSVIVQDWDESVPDQCIAINLACELLRHRATIARVKALADELRQFADVGIAGATAAKIADDIDATLENGK